MAFRFRPMIAAAAIAILSAGVANAQSTPTPTPAPSPDQVINQTKGAPGPYAAWPVISKDNLPVGTVSYSPETSEGKLPYVVVRAPNGHEFKLTNGISVIPNAISIELTKAQVDMYTVDPFTSIVLP